MRSGRHLSPAPSAAAEIFEATVAVVQAPPGMDGVGVITTAARQAQIDPVLLVPAEPLSLDSGEAGETGDAARAAALTALVEDEAERHPAADGTVALVLTRTAPWSLADQRVVARIARRLPAMRLILVTGTVEAFPVAPGVVLFAGRDLILTRAEAIEFLSARGVGLTPQTADALTDLTGGWPGLLEVAANALQQWPVATEAALDIAAHAVHQEVRRRLVPWLPRPWNTTVAHLAIAGPTSPAELAAARPEGPLPIADLVRHGLAGPQPGDPEHLRLLAPLGAVVVEEFRRGSPDALASLTEQVADLRLALGSGDCGLGLAHRSGDWGRCIRILDTHHTTLLSAAPASLVRDVLQDLPTAALADHPALRDHAAILGLPVPPPALNGFGAGAGAASSSSANPARRLVEAALAVARRRRDADIDDALAIIARSEDLARSVDPAVTGAALPIYHLSVGYTRLVAGDDAGAVRSLQSGWNERARAAPGQAHATAFYLALRHALRGEHEEAAAWSRVADQNRRPLRGSPLDTRPIAGLLDALRSIDAIAPRTAVAADACVAQNDPRWIFHAWATSLTALTERRPADALAALASPPPGSLFGLHQTLVATGRANAHLALGQGTSAAAELEIFGEHDLRTTVSRARLALLSGDLAGAVAESTGALTIQGPALRGRIELALIHAAALAGSGDAAGATRVAGRALELVRLNGHPRALLTLPGVHAERLTHLVEGLGPELDEAYRRAPGPMYPDRVTIVQLTDRERAVLRALVGTGGQEALAQVLHVSRNTVKSQLRSLYTKLGVHSRDEALAAARRQRLLD